MSEPDHSRDAAGPQVRRMWLLGTPVAVTSYEEFAAFCLAAVRQPRPWAVDFSNTHIITMRRSEKAFRAATAQIDYFVPDGMPLVWCLNLGGAGLTDRVYGPTFMDFFLSRSRGGGTHYLIGGTDEIVSLLRKKYSQVRFVGSNTEFFPAEEAATDESRARESAVLEEINRLSPDFIWVCLGSPKQQEFVNRNKSRLLRGVILGVGFAFDVNAGTKKDAPMWMQRRGLTWIFRMFSEPKRLMGRYLRYNSGFLAYLCFDLIRGKAFKPHKWSNSPHN